MAFVPVPGVTAVTVDWLLDNQPAVTTFHYDTGHLSATDIHTLCTTVMNYIESNWMGGLGVSTQLVKVRGRALDSQADNENQVSPATEIDGTNPTRELPNNVTFAIKRKTGLSGRHNRGRVYWPSICENVLTGANTIDSGSADGLVAHLNGLLVAVAAATPGGPEVLVDRKTGSTVAVTGYAYTDVFLDSQRRRLPGHNIHR